MCPGCRALSFLKEKIKERALAWFGRLPQFVDLEMNKLLIHS